MVSQHLTIDILNHAGGDLYARTGEGESRAVLFSVTSGGDNGDDTIYVSINNPVVEARIVKPDNTFTITTAELISGPDGPQEFRFYIPEAASQVSGIGSYDIRIQEDGEENIVYSAQGRFICDDNMITDEMINSVAEVDGLIFPDDFLTKDSGAATIDDTETALDSTWSSEKISNTISHTAGELEAEIDNIINDEETGLNSTWSSDKIAEEFSALDPKHIYSTEEHIVGTWIDNRPVYERTYVVIKLSPRGTFEERITIPNVLLLDYEKNYASYLYEGAWNYVTGDQLSINNSVGMKIMNFNQRLGAINVTCAIGTTDETRLYFTLRYIKL